MSLLSIYDKHEYSAEWNIPGSENRISGRLSYTHERAELSLNDTFTPLSGPISISDPIREYPAIHGISSKGEAISLLNTQSLGVSLNISSGGMRQPERLISPWVIVGAHVTPDTLYTSVNFYIPGLEAWLSKPAIEEQSSIDPESKRITNSFIINPPNPEKTPASHISSVLEWGFSTSIAPNKFTSLEVTVHGWVSIHPQTPQSLEWFLDQHAKLATLLALMAGAPMPARAIHASIGSLTNFPLSVLVTIQQAEPCKLKHPLDFFVPRGVLGPIFPAIIEQWFLEINSVLIPSQLALATLSTENLWLHVKFLSLMQALEGFHRGRFQGNYMEESEYEKIKSTISSSIPASVANDHRDALRSRIRYGNQISLSKRLNELRNYIGDSLAALIISADSKIPRNWIDTRNYLSHWDEELRPFAIDGQEMYNANIRIENFLRVLYLLTAGIPHEIIHRSLNNSSRTSQQLIRLNKIARHKADSSAPSGVIMTINASDNS